MRPPPVNLEKLLERLLTARPNAGPEEVKLLAPYFREVSDAALSELMTRMRQRIAAKAKRRRKPAD